MKHKLHPSYLAAFRGGPHPMHPQSRAWHSQYVLHLCEGTNGLYQLGADEHGEMVFAFTGAWLWYRAADFARLCRGAKDARYRAIADEFEQQEVAR